MQQSQLMDERIRSVESSISTNEVAQLSGLSVNQVRHIVRRGLINPSRGEREKFEYSFQDVVVLRNIKKMEALSVSMKKILKTITLLNEDRTSSRLSATKLQVIGSELAVVKDQSAWDPTTGQTLLNFDAVDDKSRDNIQKFPSERRGDRTRLREIDDRIARGSLSSDDWFEVGVELESIDARRACDAYKQAIKMDENNADAYNNLGRLLQLDDKLRDARQLYERVLQIDPDSELAAYNLGTIFHTLEEFDLALKYYRRARNMSIAHHNIAQIYEEKGDEVSARWHMRRSRELELQSDDDS